MFKILTLDCRKKELSEGEPALKNIQKPFMKWNPDWGLSTPVSGTILCDFGSLEKVISLLLFGHSDPARFFYNMQTQLTVQKLFLSK